MDSKKNQNNAILFLIILTVVFMLLTIMISIVTPYSENNDSENHSREIANYELVVSTFLNLATELAGGVVLLVILDRMFGTEENSLKDIEKNIITMRRQNRKLYNMLSSFRSENLSDTITYDNTENLLDAIKILINTGRIDEYHLDVLRQYDVFTEEVFEELEALRNE